MSDTSVYKPDAEEDPAKIRAGVVPKDDYPIATKTRAYDLYLNGDMNFSNIALELGVPRLQVVEWSRQGGWMLRKQALEKELVYANEARFRDFRGQEKQKEAEKQLKIAQSGEEFIGILLDDMKAQLTVGNAPTAGKIKALMEALVAASGIAARAVGLNDESKLDVQPQNQGGTARQPIIIIGQGAEPRAPLDVQVIDVDSKEVHHA